MKLNGIIGKGTGKLGSSVFAISGGEQIVREYNPVVSNPNTEAQIAQRAKLKLMSQLGAALAPALGFAKQGLVSARNQFVSKNIGSCTFEENEASVDIIDIQLTPSNVGFPSLTLAMGGEGGIAVSLASPAAADVKRVAYFVYSRVGGEQLEYVSSKIITEPGAERTFPAQFDAPLGEYVVYGYGIKDNSVNATMRYENYEVPLEATDATLDVIPLFRSAGYALTKTVGGLITIV